MVKSKKLSRGSLAVLLLALVLACSMVVGLTGAWFTDHDVNSKSTTKNLGAIKVTATLGADITDDIEAERVVDSVEQLLPGDVFTIPDVTISSSGSDVDEYVYWEYELSINFAAGKKVTAIDTYAETDASPAELKVKGAQQAAADNAPMAFVFGANSGSQQDSDPTQSMLKMYAPTGSQVVEGYTLTFTTGNGDYFNGEVSVGNYFYVKSGANFVRYVLNKGDDYVAQVGDIIVADQNITITVEVKAWALQEDNVTLATLNAWLDDIGTAGAVAAKPANESKFNELATGKISTAVHVTNHSNS